MAPGLRIMPEASPWADSHSSPVVMSVCASQPYAPGGGPCGSSDRAPALLRLAARSFYDRDAPIYTMSRFLPPSKVQDAEISQSILGDGSVVRSLPRTSA